MCTDPVFSFSTVHVQYVARHSTADERRRKRTRDPLPARRNRAHRRHLETTRVEGTTPSPRICSRLNNLHHPRIRCDRRPIHHNIWTTNSTSALQTMHCWTHRVYELDATRHPCVLHECETVPLKFSTCTYLHLCSFRRGKISRCL